MRNIKGLGVDANRLVSKKELHMHWKKKEIYLQFPEQILFPFHTLLNIFQV